jgi:hypothetical protein
MIRAHLLVNALLYFVLAAWCTLAPQKTSAAIGFGLLRNSARSEYLVVYGGLELGLALFYLLAGLDASLWKAGILFSLCLYAGLALYRLGTILFLRDLGTFPYVMFGIEASMLLWAGVAWWRGFPSA